MRRNALAVMLLCATMPGFAVTGGRPEPRQSDIEQIPAKMKVVPYVEENKAPAFTAGEKQRGFMLFSRPITAPVFPESVPLAHERITSLHTFGARGQYVNLNFCVYPLKDLASLQVRDSGGPGERELRHLAYWLVRFPGHGSAGACRRTPTFLFAHETPLRDIPKGEPHRFFLTVKVPEDAPEGTLRGKLTVEISGAKTEIPYGIDVLPFKLKRDPKKKFSAYNYDIYRHRDQIGYPFKTPEALYRAQVNQYRRMKEYGFDFLGTVYTSFEPREGKYLNIPDLDLLLKAAREAKLPVPFLYVNFCHTNYFYRKHTGKSLGGHAKGPLPPPKAMFTEMDTMFKHLRKEVDSGKMPDPLFAALDEPAESAEELAVNLYKVIKQNGFKTILTQPTFEESVSPYVDYWCDQYFRPLSEVVRREKKLYFCYPNFNSYELTDNCIMTRGGRMVYGLGMWKSDYNVHVPWIFYCRNHRLTRSGGGNFVTADGRTEMAVYWECFREGITDGEYIYTLQEAIVRREGTRDPKLRALLKEGRALLQKIWLETPWAHIYQREGFLTDYDFDGCRAAVAAILTRIMRYRELNQKQAPPILVDNIPELKEPPQNDANLVRWAAYEHTSGTDLAALHEQGAKAKKLYIREIPVNEWCVQEKGGTVSAAGEGVTRFECRMDKKNNPGRIAMMTDFGGEAENLLDYDYLIYRVKVSSNRKAGRNFTWFPLNMILPGKNDVRSKNIIKRQEPGEYVTRTYPIHELRDGFAYCSEDMKKVPYLRLELMPLRYCDGDRISFDFRDFAFVRFTEPLIHSLKTPAALRRNDPVLGYKLVVFGTQRRPNLDVEERFEDGKGGMLYKNTLPLTRPDFTGGIPLEGVKFAPGTKRATLRVAIRDRKSGKILAEASSAVAIVDL